MILRAPRTRPQCLRAKQSLPIISAYCLESVFASFFPFSTNYKTTFVQFIFEFIFIPFFREGWRISRVARAVLRLKRSRKSISHLLSTSKENPIRDVYIFDTHTR